MFFILFFITVEVWVYVLIYLYVIALMNCLWITWASPMCPKKTWASPMVNLYKGNFIIYYYVMLFINIYFECRKHSVSIYLYFYFILVLNCNFNYTNLYQLNLNERKKIYIIVSFLCDIFYFVWSHNKQVHSKLKFIGCN
jgi:hypothetical protein